MPTPSPVSVRTKSAPGYRALGTRSPSLTSHEEAEHEYTFVRAIVDAMANRSGQSPHDTSSLRPAPIYNRAWPAMYIREPSMLNATQPSSPPPFQRYYGFIAEAPATPVLTQLGSYQMDNGRKRTVQTPTTAIPDTPGYRYRPRNFPVAAMSDQSVVVPLNSPSLVHLQLTGDAKQITPTERTATSSYPSPRTRPRNFLLRRSLGNRLSTPAASTGAEPLSLAESGRAQTQKPEPVLNNGEKERTKYRFRLRSAKRNKTSSLRPATSPEGKSRQGLAISRYDKSDPQDNDTKPKSAARARRTENDRYFQKDRSNTKSTIRMTTVTMPATRGGINGKSDNTAVGSLDQSAERADVSRDQSESQPVESVPGHTKLTKSPGTISLSVFLPRENSSLDRPCQRSSVVTTPVSSQFPDDNDGDPEGATIPGTEEESRSGRSPKCDRGTSTASTVPSPGTPRDPTTPREDGDHQDEENGTEVEGTDEEPEGVGRKLRNSGLDLRRSIHCELFGPDLCGDCKRHCDREDVRNWQNVVYPGIVADPKLLVAAPMLRRQQQARLSFDPSLGPNSKPKSANSAPRLGLSTNYKPPLLYSSVPTAADSPMTVSSPYGVHPWRLTGSGNPLTRTLKSVVTQNEIRTRIWASSDSPRSRRQGVAILTS